jgi:hypothetical protein
MLDIVRKALALLIGLRGLTNFGKPFSEHAGFVAFGKLTHGVGATVVAPLVGLAIVVYAWGLWQARPWARPLAVAFALWSTLNVLLFPLVEGLPPNVTPALYALFAIGGIAGPWLAVWLLRSDAAAR